MVQDPKLNKPEKMEEVVTADDMNVDIMKMGSGLGTSAGKSSDSKHGVANAGNSVGGGGHPSVPVFVPEGRVHGGSLMAMLAGSSGVSSNSSKFVVAGDALMTGKSSIMPQSWM